MKQRNKCILWFLKAIFAGILALFLLSLFLAAYSNSRIHVTSTTGATDYTWESNQWKSTMTEGYAWIRMDENGFNNAYATDKDTIDILLMGSSHMEAVNIGKTENVGYLLNELLPGCHTYNIGISGHQIYHCVNNLDAAVETYQPTSWVIIETGSVKLDTGTMQEVIDGTYGHIRSYDSGLIYYMQKYIPAVKALFKNSSDWVGMDRPVADTAIDNSVDEDYAEILGEFLKKAKNSLETGQQLLIFYQPATGIDSDGKYIQRDDGYLEIFRQECEGNGIVFVDMTEDFRRLYEEQHILAHGFTNTAVGVGHLNTYGHEVVAEKLVSIIRNGG